jgi:glycosyltransferase involved in cell wall biosynthesis
LQNCIKRDDVSAPFKILFLSRINQKKGLEILFEALQHFNTNWTLTIAGTGPPQYKRALISRAKELLIEKRIIWTGYADPVMKADLLARHDLFVLYSQNENFANVVAESLMAGTAVAISNNIGLAPMVREHDLGWTCEANPTAINADLHDAMVQTEKRRYVREQGPAIAKRMFSGDKLLNQYKKLYHQINDKSAFLFHNSHAK